MCICVGGVVDVVVGGDVGCGEIVVAAGCGGMAVVVSNAGDGVCAGAGCGCCDGVVVYADRCGGDCDIVDVVGGGVGYIVFGGDGIDVEYDVFGDGCGVVVRDVVCCYGVAVVGIDFVGVGVGVVVVCVGVLLVFALVLMLLMCVGDVGVDDCVHMLCC